MAAVAGFLFGFDTVVISGTTEMLTKQFDLTKLMLGVTVSSALVGTVIGSLVAGKPAEWLGRKPILLWLAVLYFVSALGCGLAWSWPALLAFRFVGGLAIGGASVVAPLYIAEISPPQIRGRLVAINQLNIVAGLLVAYVSNYAIATVLPGDPQAWRWMLGMVGRSGRRVSAVGAADSRKPALAGETPSPRRSPRRSAEARQRGRRRGDAGHRRFVARRDRGGRRTVLPAQIPETDPAGLHGGDVQPVVRHQRHPLLQRPHLHHGRGGPNQRAGAVDHHRPDEPGLHAGRHVGDRPFRPAEAADHRRGRLDGLSVGDRLRLLDERSNRRRRHAGRPTSWLVGWTVLGSLIGFIAFFAFSSGAVIWVFISEIFPNRVRARGQALGSFTHWFWCALISFGFPSIADYSKGAPFLFFAAMMLLQLVLVWKFLPETKRVSLEEMQRHLGIE